MSYVQNLKDVVVIISHMLGSLRNLRFGLWVAYGVFFGCFPAQRHRSHLL